jgi:hypothetical protein
MEVSGQLHTPAAFSQGKSPQYPLDRRLGGPQSHSGYGGGEKNSQPPPEIEPQNPDHPAHSQSLSWLTLQLDFINFKNKTVSNNFIVTF